MRSAAKRGEEIHMKFDNIKPRKGEKVRQAVVVEGAARKAVDKQIPNSAISAGPKKKKK
jgi:hypothetical protein